MENGNFEEVIKVQIKRQWSEKKSMFKNEHRFFYSLKNVSLKCKNLIKMT